MTFGEKHVGSEMKVAIFGATGGTGRIMIRKAIERGHEVTAAARNPSALLGGHERLRVGKADVMQPQTLEAVVEDQDAVITSVSVGNALKEGRKPTTLFSDVTRNRSRLTRAAAGRIVREALSPTLNRPEEELSQRLLVGPAGECAEKLAAYQAAGAQRIFLCRWRTSCASWRSFG